MDSQLSLFGFEETPSDKKEEARAKSTTKKQAAKDAGPEVSLFGESVSDDVPAIENDAPNKEVTEEINNDIVEQEEGVNTAASEEIVFATTENYSISEDEYQQLDENSEDEFPWDEQVIPDEEIYTDAQVEIENFAADENVEDYIEEPTIYLSEERAELECLGQDSISKNSDLGFPTNEMSAELLNSDSEPEYVEPAPIFESNDVSEIEESILEEEKDTEIVQEEDINTPESSETVSEEAAFGNNEENQEAILDAENSEPEYIEPVPTFESNNVSEIEESILEEEKDTEIVQEEDTNTPESSETVSKEAAFDNNEEFQEPILFAENSEPEYVEPAPIFESNDVSEIEESILEEEKDTEIVQEEDTNTPESSETVSEEAAFDNNEEFQEPILFAENSEPEYVEPAPIFESNDVSEIEESILEEEKDTEIVQEEDTNTPESSETVSEEAEFGNNEENQEAILDAENSEPEYIEPVPTFESNDVSEIEESILEEEKDTEIVQEEDTNTPERSEIVSEEVELGNNEEFQEPENSEPKYVEPAAPTSESEVVTSETSEISEFAENENPQEQYLPEFKEENEEISTDEMVFDYPDFWDEKVKKETTSNIPLAKDLFGETIVAPKKEVFKAGKRGRKSFKEIDAEVDLIEVPEDDILFSKQYYPISEVAKWFRVNNSLLRFWENEFDILKPRKNRKGDRLFRPEDIKNLQVIYYLLRNKKYTIDGAKKYLKTNKKTADVNLQIIHALNNFKGFLLELKTNIS
ncbi:MerR family transcriptional regulator [Rhizosphaericola mali]|nr:MerR family transcriptional regulator [Rhizosphaericola mali]